MAKVAPVAMMAALPGVAAKFGVAALRSPAGSKAASVFAAASAKLLRFAKIGGIPGTKAGTLAGTAVQLATKFMQRPFRTSLPFAGAAGLWKGATGYGDDKGGSRAGQGGAIGGLIGGGGYTATAPPVMRTMGTMVEPELVRTWSTGTATFGQDIEGRYWVTTKKGWKRYTPKKPIVLGTKHLTPGKFISAAKKYYQMKKDLDKVFKTVKRRKK